MPNFNFDSLSSWDYINDSRPASVQIVTLGKLIDAASDERNEDAFSLALSWAKHLESRGVPYDIEAQLYYYTANAFSGLHKVLQGKGQDLWLWDSKTLDGQILYYRKSINANLTKWKRTDLPSRIHTNLGNLFDHVGRFIEAQRQWSKALIYQNKYAMALANQAKGFYEFASYQFDPGHKYIMLIRAAQLLRSAIETGLPKYAKDSFVSLYNKLLRSLGRNENTMPENIPVKEFSLGRSKDERLYRRWCLHNQLFLNPLNEISELSAFAHDILTLPPLDTKGLKSPIYHALFNEIKQEFVFSRYLLYRSREPRDKFVNKALHVIDTLDYPEYGLHIQQLKTSFRIAYGIFDKLAYFLNEYLQLGVQKDSVSFRKIWHTKHKNGLHLRQEFLSRPNWALRGLYWLSKDLYEPDEYAETLEPQSKDLRIIRNHLEHKCLRVFWMLADDKCGEVGSSKQRLDRVTYNISKEDLEEKTYRILSLVREAIVYTVFAVWTEEIRINSISQKTGEPGIVGQLPLYDYRF